MILKKRNMINMYLKRLKELCEKYGLPCTQIGYYSLR